MITINWRDLLDMDEKDKTKHASTLHNARLFLEHHEDFAGTIVWNDYAKQLEIKVVEGKTALAAYKESDADGIVAGIQDYLAHTHEISVSFTDLVKRVMFVAMKNRYNPLVNHLMSLKHDGIPRIDNFFIMYFGAGKFANPNAPTKEELDRLAHLRRIGRRWLLGAIERAFRPGSKVDNILILEGLQGARKTSALEALGGDYYCSTHITLGEKDSKMIAASNWFVDMPDTTFMKKNNRGFITMRKDTFRPPFGAAVKHSPRCCIFIGSMNDYQYLEEEERRYWPVFCAELRLEALMRDIDQIWAEAVAISLASATCPDCLASTDTVFKQVPRCATHRWWLNAEEEREAAREASDRVQDMPWKLLIHEWWLDMEIAKRPEYFTTEDVAMNALRMEESNFARGDKTAMAIGTAVKALGFVKERLMINGVRHWVYKPTEALVTATRAPKPVRGMLVGIKGGKAK